MSRTDFTGVTAATATVKREMFNSLGEKLMPALKDKAVLIIGRGSGIARARGGYHDLTAR
jgi:hypothetical protein